MQFLHLSKCELDDEKINAFLHGIKLVNINELILGKNIGVSPVGWLMMRDSISSALCLNRLDLLDCSLDDEKLTSIFEGM